MKNDFPRVKTSPEIKRKQVETARLFRKEPTRSEHILWQALCGKKLDGIKFRRQQPIGNFIVDFYNSVYRLVVEVDGSVHNKQLELGRSRQDTLAQLGLNVLRVRAEDVEKNLPFVLAQIRSKINELGTKAGEFPSPFIGEGLGEREDNDEREKGEFHD
jgi:very-short-patch-repair endonuclease